MNSFIRKNDTFNMFAQNIDYGYTLEPPRRGGSDESDSDEYPQSMFCLKQNYTPVNPIFTIYKWGIRGYSLHMTCLHFTIIHATIGC